MRSSPRHSRSAAPRFIVCWKRLHRDSRPSIRPLGLRLNGSGHSNVTISMKWHPSLCGTPHPSYRRSTSDGAGFLRPLSRQRGQDLLVARITGSDPEGDIGGTDGFDAPPLGGGQAGPFTIVRRARVTWLADTRTRPLDRPTSLHRR